MSVITTQQLTRLYDIYRDTELTFTKEIVTTLNLDLRQVALKCLGSQWSCIINSASLSSAKIIVGTKGGAYAAVTKENASVSLRFYFVNPSDKQPLSFFVNARVDNIAKYGGNDELVIVTLNYTQRPPDDLIEIMGRLLETNENAVRYKDLSVPLNDDAKRRIGILREDTIVFIQNVPRHCIIRDIGFGKAKIMLLGLAPFLKNKQVSLKVDFDEPKAIVNLTGVISGTEDIAGRKDIITAIIDFDESSVPMLYKMQLNGYITSNFNKRAVSAHQQQAQSMQATTAPVQPAPVTPVQAPAASAASPAEDASQKTEETDSAAEVVNQDEKTPPSETVEPNSSEVTQEAEQDKGDAEPAVEEKPSSAEPNA